MQPLRVYCCRGGRITWMHTYSELLGQKLYHLHKHSVVSSKLYGNVVKRIHDYFYSRILLLFRYQQIKMAAQNRKVSNFRSLCMGLFLFHYNFYASEHIQILSLHITCYSLHIIAKILNHIETLDSGYIFRLDCHLFRFFNLIINYCIA